jgi:hypothetical protein
MPSGVYPGPNDCNSPYTLIVWTLLTLDGASADYTSLWSLEAGYIKGGCKDAHSVFSRRPPGDLLMMLCIRNKHQELACVMNKHDVDIDYRDTKGNTLMHCACQEGHLSIVQQLRIFGARTEGVVNNIGMEPLHCAMLGRRLAMVQYLIEDCGVSAHTTFSENLTILHILAVDTDMEILEYLYHNKNLALVDVDQQGGTLKTTAVYNAAMHGNYYVVKWLCTELQADINIQATDHTTAVTIALIHQRARVVRYFAHRHDVRVASGWTVDGKSVEKTLQQIAQKYLCDRGRWCPNRGKNACGGCEKVKYCSQKCQILHWRAGHRKVCRQRV